MPRQAFTTCVGGSASASQGQQRPCLPETDPDEVVGTASATPSASVRRRAAAARDGPADAPVGMPMRARMRVTVTEHPDGADRKAATGKRTRMAALRTSPSTEVAGS